MYELICHRNSTQHTNSTDGNDLNLLSILTGEKIFLDEKQCKGREFLKCLIHSADIAQQDRKQNIV